MGTLGTLSLGYWDSGYPLWTWIWIGHSPTGSGSAIYKKPKRNKKKEIFREWNMGNIYLHFSAPKKIKKWKFVTFWTFQSISGES